MTMHSQLRGRENSEQYDEQPGKPPRKSHALPGNLPGNKGNGRNTRQPRPNNMISAKIANKQEPGMEQDGEGDKTGNAFISWQREGNQG